MHNVQSQSTKWEIRARAACGANSRACGRGDDGVDSGSEPMRAASLGSNPPRTGRGYVVGCIERGYPHALRRGLGKVNADKAAESMRAIRREAYMFHLAFRQMKLVSWRGFTAPIFEPPSRRQLFPAPVVRLGGVPPSALTTNATPPYAGWIHAKGGCSHRPAATNNGRRPVWQHARRALVIFAA